MYDFQSIVRDRLLFMIRHYSFVYLRAGLYMRRTLESSLYALAFSVLRRICFFLLSN